MEAMAPELSSTKAAEAYRLKVNVPQGPAACLNPPAGVEKPTSEHKPACKLPAAITKGIGQIPI